MSQHDALPNLGLELFTKRRRVNIACVHCRRRKVKCSTSDASSSAPCGRCSKMGLSCTYVPVAAQYGDSSSPVGEKGEFSKLRRSSTSSPTAHFHETHLNPVNLPTRNERRSSATKDEPVEIQLPPFEHGFADDLFNSNLPDSTSWDFPHALQPACSSTPFLPNYIPNQPYGADCRPHLSSYPVDPRCLPSPLDLYHGSSIYSSPPSNDNGWQRGIGLPVSNF
ncbi:hypothetical protein R3P38DRAFT_2878852 [Favolaschia claudopus]|uniref:Zn(2)-C6 fungal-type domain-containing protein n=1 Tax=Favolaschia claudopus TaxID=2862362 RepID=A0AAW0CYX6_9AGAR